MMKQLKSVVKNAQINEKFVSSLKEEISSSISSRILVEDRAIEDVCRDALDEVATSRRMKKHHGSLKVSTLLKMSQNEMAAVRRLAAALLPEGQLHRLSSDAHWAVRSEVAQRVSLPELKTMARRFPNDLNVKQIYEDRVKESFTEPLQRSPWTDKTVRLALSDARLDGDVLTDAWYENLANFIFNEFKSTVNMYTGDYMDTNAVRRYANLFVLHARSVGAAAGWNSDKLTKAIDKHIEEYEERIMKKYGIEETIDSLGRKELLEETVLYIEHEQDEVEELMEQCLTSSEFLQKVDVLFQIEEGNTLTKKQANILVHEGVDPCDLSMPVSGRLLDPDIRRVDERVLDRYCAIWNERRAREGSVLRIQWVNDDKDVSFRVIV